MLLEEFASADLSVVATGAVQAAAAPPRMGSCLDEAVLGGLAEVPDKGAQTVMSAHRQLVRARVLHAEGRFEHALVAAREARARAEADALAQLALSARGTQALLLYSTGEFVASAALAETTYFEAMRRSNWNVAATSARARLYIAAAREQPEQATLWAELASVSLAHAGDPPGLREARLVGALSMARRLSGDLRSAQLLARRSLAVIDSMLGPKHPWVADSLVELGRVPAESGAGAKY